MKKSIFGIINAVVISAMLITGCASTDKAAPTSNYDSKYTKDWETLSEDNSQNCGKFCTTSEMGKFAMIEGEFRKDKGSEQSCFGFVFGYTSPSDGVLSDYIRFEINTLGEYAVYSWDGKVYADFVNDDAVNTAYMNESSAINKGLGAANVLKVEKTSDGTYSCFINGTKVCSGIEVPEEATKGVMAFYSVGSADQENLPNDKVEVSFRITDSAFN